VCSSERQGEGRLMRGERQMEARAGGQGGERQNERPRRREAARGHARNADNEGRGELLARAPTIATRPWASKRVKKRALERAPGRGRLRLRHQAA